MSDTANRKHKPGNRFGQVQRRRSDEQSTCSLRWFLFHASSIDARRCFGKGGDMAQKWPFASACFRAQRGLSRLSRVMDALSPRCRGITQDGTADLGERINSSASRLVDAGNR